MPDGKLHFGVGLFIGVLLAAIFFLFFAPRYQTTQTEGALVKQDKWSGNSWRFVGNHWEKVVDLDRDWKRIDKDLKSALNVSDKGIDREATLSLLKEKYVSLRNLSDDELLERIKLVYSKEILVNLYLSNFKDMQRANGKK